MTKRVSQAAAPNAFRSKQVSLILIIIITLECDVLIRIDQTTPLIYKVNDTETGRFVENTDRDFITRSLSIIFIDHMFYRLVWSSKPHTLKNKIISDMKLLEVFSNAYMTYLYINILSSVVLDKKIVKYYSKLASKFLELSVNNFL